MKEQPDEDGLPVLRIVTTHSSGDCAICCLAMLLGYQYEDILALASCTMGNDSIHYAGMWVKEIVGLAKLLDVKLHRRKRFDLDSACGILSMQNTRTGDGHVVVLKNGLIFDTDGTVWEVDCYFRNTKYVTDCLLTLT